MPRNHKGKQCYRNHIWYDDTDDLVTKLREVADMIEASGEMFDKPDWLEEFHSNWGGDGP